jgi:hypothetical protein
VQRTNPNCAVHEITPLQLDFRQTISKNANGPDVAYEIYLTSDIERNGYHA